ncbi:hypothetical protein SAMN04489731_115132 [Amycolatopsis regifaucium]|nr:hypothetical protein SAMN04489731_115132 [Amycolatopsis regifaucium]
MTSPEGGRKLLIVGHRVGRDAGVAARFTQIVSAGVLVTGVLAGFLKLWDSSLPLGWDVLGFLFLTSTGFAALQTGLPRLLGVRAMALLGPLYLVAPAVAGQVPELPSRSARRNQPSRRLKRTRRTGLSRLVSTRQIDCQVPSVSTPPRTGIVAYGGSSAGRTWSRP